MSEPKPVELTEAEMDAIIKGFFPFDHSCAHNVGPVFDVIESIIAAREAAARREAWDEGWAAGKADVLYAQAQAHWSYIGPRRPATSPSPYRATEGEQ